MKKALIISLINLSTMLSAAIYYPGGDQLTGGDIDNLNNAILAANNSADDDVIDLGGYRYIYPETYIPYANPDISDPEIDCFSALPPIPCATSNCAASGKLSIVNGTIQGGGSASNFRIIYNQGNLSLFNVTLENAYNNNVCEGSALYNDSNGILNLDNAYIVQNYSLGGRGGGIFNFGLIDNITNSNISQNISFSNDGGGIFNSGTIIDIHNTNLSGNLAGYSGGGIYNFGTIAQITNSLLASNSGGSYATGNCGGGLHSARPLNNFTNNTVSGNILYGSPGYGGGICCTNRIETVANNTISQNSAIDGGGGIYNSSTIVSLVSNIIASNSESSPNDIYNTGSIGAGIKGYNLTDAVGNVGYTADATDILITSSSQLNLGNLQDNGGPTFTMALLPGSFAINSGFNFLNLIYDQRGLPFKRICGGMIDIGAYELQALCRAN